MKLKYFFIIVVSIALVIFLSILNPIKAQTNTKINTLFQTSTIGALLTGIYDGSMSFQELKRHGNFGLGTVNGLDGEMIGLDGKFYQIKSNGIAYEIPDVSKTPFALVTFFQPEQSIDLKGKLNYQQFQQELDRQLSTKNYPYAIRIRGEFSGLKLRSVPKQTLPYRPAVEVTKEQSIFELKNVKGTLVGFRSPKYLQNLNVNGYHFHFLSENRKNGGHLLDGFFKNAKVEVEILSDLKIDLPRTPEFNQANLGDDISGDVNRVEK